MSTHVETKPTPLAIIGIGCLFPKADGLGAYWANVKNAVDCITEIPPTHWDPEHYFDADPKAPDMTYARRGGFLSPVEFHPREFGIPPRDIEATDTSQLLGLLAAKQALVDAGIVFKDKDSVGGVDRNRVSVILGVTGTLELVIPLGARLGHPRWKQAMKDAGVPDDVATDAALRIADSYVPWQENSFPGLLGNVVAGRIANKLDLGGTNCVVDAACASSLSAVHLASLELSAGLADVVVTGGADTFNDIFMYMCFSKTPALSATGDAKPFDANGDGTILGEGLGVVVLKRLADAERDGDRVYAVLRGIGSSSDGKGNAIYAPSAAGQKNALRNAYRLADVTPDTIELVEAHGTGTRVGDAVEVAALTEVYGVSRDAEALRSGALASEAPDAEENGLHAPALRSEDSASRLTRDPWAALGSVKSQIGHTKAAAGAASLIKTALALHYKVLPPTVKVTDPVEPLRAAGSPFYVNTIKRPWLPRAEHPRRAAMSAFGFGGSNFHAVLEEYRPAKTEVDWDGSVEIVALGAETPQELASRLNEFPVADWPAFARAAETSRASFHADAPCRLCFAAHRERSDWQKLVAGVKAKLAAEPDALAWHTPEGAHYGRGPAPGTLAVLFPGQGSQYVGMLRDLACQFPEVLDALTLANEGVDLNGRRLSDRIYPPTSFAPDAKKQQDAELRDTRAAQPAIGAVSAGAWALLRDRFGLNADSFAGHSYGELVALFAAGRFGSAELFALSRLRGELMARQRSGDPGSMLAVSVLRSEVEAVLREESLGLVVANANAPRQIVLSGPSVEIDRAAALFTSRKMACQKLPVAAAFHSPLVADAAEPFRAGLDAIAFEPGLVPVFANTTAAPYPEDAAAARDLLARQLAKPVAFVEQIRAMAAVGVRTFVEIGPGAVLSRLANAILADGATGAVAADADAFALDESGGKRPGVLDLGNVLARLAARGHAVRLVSWESGSRCQPAPPAGPPGLTVWLSGANHVQPRAKRPPRAAAPTANGVHAATGMQPPALSVLATAKGLSMSDSANTPGPLTGDSNALALALQMTQQTLAALHQMQEQAAQLHRQFLDSQDAAQRTLHALVEQQQVLLLGGRGSAVPFTPLPPLPRPPFSPIAPAPPALRSEDSASRLNEGPVAPPPAPAASERVRSTLLAVVSEKTGYPESSLELSLSLDADLGIDSIKRVEILSALQERLPEAPVVKPEHLGTLHTLQDVADFLAGAPVPSKEEVEDSEDGPRTMALSALILHSRGDGAAPLVAPPSTPIAPIQALLSAGPDSSAVQKVLLAVVSEKTGYPESSLELSLSLDADLGIDSIKRVEILSALQERLPEAPVVKPEHLGTLHTLQDVADFLIGPGPKTEQVSKIHPIQATDSVMRIAPSLAASPALQDTTRATTTVPVAAIARPPAPWPTEPARPASETHRPSATLAGRPGQAQGGARPAPEAHRPSAAPLGAERVDRSILQAVDLDLQVPRPRVLAGGGEIWVVGDTDPLTEAVVEQLARQGFHARAMGWGGPGANRPTGPLAGLVLLAAAHPGPESGLNRLAFQWVQQVAGKLRQTARQGAAVIATVARLDGAFGLNQLAADADPTAGGLAGLIKTARYEWPEVACKAIDLDPAFDNVEAAAAAVVDEVLSSGPLEVGIAANHRCTLELARTVRRQTHRVIDLSPKDVVLITGGARGVTAETAVALAETYRPMLVLTGRTPISEPEPEWLAGLTAEADLKQAISENVGANSGPRQVGEFYQKVLAQREVRRTLKRVEEAGAKVAYFPVDVTNEKAVADMLQRVRSKFGPLTALVHGAGVLADKRIEDLTPDQFDNVYATKVDGLRNLLDLLAHEELKALVLFSSTTARLGRIGQAAYAVANEVLNKTAQVEARRRPGCRVVAVNWGPWEGGMVTPALKKLFEAEGVGTIPLADGAAFLVNELNAAGRAVEVVALGKLRPAGGSGVIPSPASRVSITTTPAPHLSGFHPAPQANGPLVSPPNVPTVEMGLVFERPLDVETHPVLKSHVLDGRAVLPMAVHLEWLAHAALHGHPGLVFHGFNDLRVTQGVMLDPQAATTIKAFAGKPMKQEKFHLIPVELRGKRRDGREVVHSRAEIVLVAALPKAPPADRAPDVEPYPHSIDEVYEELLFHGPDLRGIERVEGSSELAFVGTAYPAPSPAEWFASPLRSGWVAEPMVLDASFQMMILWCQGQHQAGSIPCFAGRYRQFRRSFPAGSVKVVIRVRRDDGRFARADIDYLDGEGVVVAQMQDYECVIEESLNQSFRRNQLGMVKS